VSAETLLAAWTAPARRRAAGVTAFGGLAIVVAFTGAAWRFGGSGAALVIALAGAVLTAFAAWRAARRFGRAWLVHALDTTHPEVEDSAALVFGDAPGHGLAALQAARIAQRLEEGDPASLAEPWPVGPLTLAWIAALAFAAAVQFVPEPAPPPPEMTAVRQVRPPAPGVPVLTAQALRVVPPAYTGLPARDLASLDTSAPEGSRVEWHLRYEPAPASVRIEPVEGQGVALSRKAERWTAGTTLVRSLLYRVEASNGAEPSPLHRINAISDEPPTVEALSPGEGLVVVRPGQRSWAPVFEASDDYGVSARAELRVTLAMGEGENVTFTERTIRITGSGPARKRRFAPVLAFSAYGFQPGGDMVAQVVVRDTRPGNPHVVRGPSVILRWPSAMEAQSTGLEGMVSLTLPAYLRSQRQIIIDAQALLQDRRRIGTERFRERSTRLGGDQQALRLRYNAFLGGESEGRGMTMPTSDREQQDDDHGGAEHEHEETQAEGDDHDHGGGPPRPAQTFGSLNSVLADYGHEHADAQSSALDPETAMKLRKAVSAMWESEVQLRQGQPAQALPHAEDALRWIKDVQQATRIYLRKLGPELPPIDPSRRMTGEREGIAGRTLAVRPVERGDGPAAAAWRALGPGRDAASGAIDFGPLRGWVARNRARLPDALGLLGAIDAAERDPACTRCRTKLRGALWAALERPPGAAMRRTRSEGEGARYLDALGGGR
jgi:hypothetical protein